MFVVCLSLCLVQCWPISVFLLSRTFFHLVKPWTLLSTHSESLIPTEPLEGRVTERLTALTQLKLWHAGLIWNLKSLCCVRMHTIFVIMHFEFVHSLWCLHLQCWNWCPTLSYLLCLKRVRCLSATILEFCSLLTGFKRIGKSIHKSS